MENIDQIPINGTIINVSTNGKTALASQIYDETTEMFQNELNKRVIDVLDNMQGSGHAAISGKLNLTDISQIKNAQALLTDTNQIAYYLITDSNGSLPSTQSCYDIPSANVRQLSLVSPSSATNLLLSVATSSVTLNPVGVNVGDLIAITRVKVATKDLIAALGVSLSISGEIELYQYKLLATNDVKAPNTGGSTVGVMGLASPWDKQQINKIPIIETGNSVNLNIFEGSYNIDQCLYPGLYKYGTTGRSMEGNHADEKYLIEVQSSYNIADNYYTVLQKVTSVNYANRIFVRIVTTYSLEYYNGEYSPWFRIDATQYPSNDNIKDVDLALEQGVYPWVYDYNNSSINEHLPTNDPYTIVVKRSNPDRNGYFTVEQTAYNRGNAKDIYKRIIFDKDDGIDIQYGRWIMVSISNGSITTDKIANGAITSNKIAEGALNEAVTPVYHAYILLSTEKVHIYNTSSPIGYSNIIINEGEDDGYVVPSYLANGTLIIYGIDYTYAFVLSTDDEGNPIGTISQKYPTKSQSYATISYVDEQLGNINSILESIING